eukprot:5089071-Amphidinium_carterae.1
MQVHSTDLLVHLLGAGTMRRAQDCGCRPRRLVSMHEERAEGSATSRSLRRLPRAARCAR